MRKLALAPTSLPEAKPMEFIAAAREADFDGVGLRLNRSPGLPFHPVAENAALVREMKRALSDANLFVLDILSFYLQPATDFAGFEPALQLGAEMGAKYAMVIGDDPDWPRLSDNFGRFCDQAGRVGLSAVIEFVAYRPLATLALAQRIVAETGRQNAVICVDPLHFARSGGKPADVRGVAPKLLPYMQLSDGVLFPGEPPAQRKAPGERRMPGEGTLPLKELLAAMPPGIPLSVEVATAETSRMPPGDWAKLVMDRTRRFLAAHDR